ncbi:MAG: FmdE family protein [Treponema sp.]|nr:FmdE family protein [Treponema sp.]
MNQSYWDRAKAFHGHACPGLAIGVKVWEAAAEKLGADPSFDEELACVVENDACGVDAIQALAGCTFGKGNLIHKDTGKHAYTFISRKTGRALRFYFKALRADMDREAFQQYLLDAPAEDLFECREIAMDIPCCARKFTSVKCELCGESAAENKIRLQEGKKVCLDCFKHYSRVLPGSSR